MVTKSFIMPTVLLALSMFTNLAMAADPIVTESTASSTVTTNGSMETTVKSPPPSAISPQLDLIVTVIFVRLV